MKNFIAGIFVGFIVLAIFFFLFDGMSLEQARRERLADLRDCADAPTGSHCKMANGREAVIITARGAK